MSSAVIRSDGEVDRAQRPKLLFLCQTLPYPPDRGVNIRSYNVLRLLARTFDVTALFFFRKQSRPTMEDVQYSLAKLSRIAEVEAFEIPQEHSVARLVFDHLRSVMSGRTYTHYAYASTKVDRRLEQVLAKKAFDIVHIDSLDLSWYLDACSGLPIVCTHHNVESEVLFRRAQLEPPMRKLYLRHQARLMRREERRWCAKFNLNVVCSRQDATMLEAVAPGSAIVVVPNGVDTRLFQPSDASTSGIVFVGSYDWFPNRDAMAHFASEIMPFLRRDGTLPRVTWVGRAPSEVQRQYSDQHGIRLTGYVDDVRPYVLEAACYIVPIRTGGGTRLKILDAWAMGKAVVSTSVGCEGLEAVDGVNILIRDDPEEFAQAVRDVLSNPRLRDTLGKGARATAASVYEWDVIGDSMEMHYMGILNRVT
jgi:glycosyltransferase involved in cell wall biosynthesis